MENEAGKPEVNPMSDRSENVYEPSPVVRDAHAESAFTRVIEQQSAKLPSHLFLFAALGSMSLSIGLAVSGRRDASHFAATAANALLTMGVYNKVVKLLGPR